MNFDDEEKITQFDRSTLVRNYDYGSISTYNLNYLDIPTFAKIEFDRAGNIIFEDYTKLDEYIEHEFIPKYIKKKNKLDKELDDKFEYFSIQLSDILKLRLSELEMIHVFEYLESKDIKIGGYSPDIDSENYDYIRTYKNFELPEHDDKVDEIQRIREYQTTKNQTLFEEIIKNNMRLALAVAYPYAIKTGHDIEEIRSFAHEGLIYAVNHFNPDRAGKFSSYAWPCIRGFILRGLPELDFIFHRKDLYQKYIIYKEMVEEYTGEDVLENPKLLNDVFNLMYETGEISLNEINVLSALIRTNIPKLDEFLFDAEDDYNLEIDVILNTTREDLIECLNCYLTEKEKKIISLRFGLYDGEPKYLEEIGKIFNVTRERIRQIERKALRKLRRPIRNKKLKGLLDLYCQKGEKTI